MTDRKVLIGEVEAGMVLHLQDQWSTGSDRLIDPDGRTLALLSEITEPGEIGTLGEVRTLYVDAQRVDTYTPDGTFGKPYINLQDALDALMTLITTIGGTQINAAIRIAPSGKYMNETGQLVMALPNTGVNTRRLALVADSVGESSVVLLPPIRVDSPDDDSINFIAMRGLNFAGKSGGGGMTSSVMHVKGHFDFTGQIRCYLSDVQFSTATFVDNAFYVDTGGGSFGLFAAGHTTFQVSASNTGNAIYMERGAMNLRGSNIWGGAAPAINLSNSASVTLMSGELTVAAGTNTTLASLEDSASLNLRDVSATGRGSGAIVSHTGSGGTITLYDVLVDSASTGEIEAFSGATVLVGICVRTTGEPVLVLAASPEQIVGIVPAAQIAYADGSNGAWATSAPLTTNEAIDRLAAQFSAHLGSTIPE